MRESLASPRASCQSASVEQTFSQRRARKAHVLRRCFACVLPISNRTSPGGVARPVHSVAFATQAKSLRPLRRRAAVAKKSACAEIFTSNPARYCSRCVKHPLNKEMRTCDERSELKRAKSLGRKDHDQPKRWRPTKPTERAHAFPQRQRGRPNAPVRPSAKRESPAARRRRRASFSSRSAPVGVVLVHPLAVSAALHSLDPFRMLEVPAHRGEQPTLDVVAL